MTTEFERAALLRSLLAPQNTANLIVPNGDDAAVLSVPGQLVVTTDTLVEGEDFAKWAPWEAVGWKAIAVNLSDLAAMGADPLGICAHCVSRVDSPTLRWLKSRVGWRPR